MQLISLERPVPWNRGKAKHMETNYRVEESKGCTLIYGQAPLDVFLHHSNSQPEGSVIDVDLARMAGANFALGLPEATATLREKLGPAAIEKMRSVYESAGFSEALVQWLAVGERGNSSNAMVQHLTGVHIPGCEPMAHPHDPDDLRRCRLLLEQCSELQQKLPRMEEVSKTWAKLIAHWDELCTLMDREAPDSRNSGSESSTPETYELMKSLGC